MGVASSQERPVGGLSSGYGQADLALAQLEAEQLAQALALSAAESRPSRPSGGAAGHRSGTGDEVLAAPPPLNTRAGVCAGCRLPLVRFLSGVTVSALGRTWHGDCFRCSICGELLREPTFAVTPDGAPCHTECHTAVHRPRCDVCDCVFASGADRVIRFSLLPFWETKFCPEHASDGTPHCVCCTRHERRGGEPHAPLPDGVGALCLECMRTVVVTEADATPLYATVADFLQAAGMEVPYLPPLRLVTAAHLTALSASAASAHEAPSSSQIRGMTLMSEISFGTFAPRRVSVTAIAVLAALPRLATGAVLAHELCHAHLRLAGCLALPPRLEEGLCQLWALLWLEHTLSVALSEEDARLGAFLAHQIRTDRSEVYGDGVRDAMRAYQRVGLQALMHAVKSYGRLPA